MNPLSRPVGVPTRLLAPIFLLALPVLSGGVAGNIAPGRWLDLPDFPVAREHPTVSMVDEEVKVWFWEDVVLVEAWYEMESLNVFGPASMMLPMFFTYPDRPELDDFEPWVVITIDGVETPVEIIHSRQYDYMSLRATLVQARFRHTFSEGRCRVEVAYLAPYVWRETPEGQRGCFEYTLGTGGAWRGPIGHGALHLAPGPGADWAILTDYGYRHLPEPVETATGIRWEFFDLVPPPDTGYWILVAPAESRE